MANKAAADPTTAGGAAMANKAAAPQQSAADYPPTVESRLREDPELTAMLRIAGLR